MALNFPKSEFGKRWHIETCTSMDKRRFGDEIKARKFWSQCRELYIIALVHNIAVLIFFVLRAFRRWRLYSLSPFVMILSTEQITPDFFRTKEETLL
jgi:hypothetical protein